MCRAETLDFRERIVTVRGLGMHRSNNVRCELRQIEHMLAFGKCLELGQPTRIESKVPKHFRPQHTLFGHTPSVLDTKHNGKQQVAQTSKR